MYLVCVVPTETTRGHWIPGIGVTDCCKWPCGSQKSIPGLLKEISALLAPEPSPQPLGQKFLLRDPFYKNILSVQFSFLSIGRNLVTGKMAATKIKMPTSVGHWEIFQTNPMLSCYFCILSGAAGHSFHHVHWNFLPVFNQSCKLGIFSLCQTESEGTFLGLLRVWECGIRL